MISKKTSLAITTLVLAASGAQASFLNKEPASGSIATEAPML
ncbi:hypothetical protein [Xylophilus ampelinus]|nr:hypothetical protein [Xylophilus ampelinus]